MQEELSLSLKSPVVPFSIFLFFFYRLSLSFSLYTHVHANTHTHKKHALLCFKIVHANCSFCYCCAAVAAVVVVVDAAVLLVCLNDRGGCLFVISHFSFDIFVHNCLLEKCKMRKKALNVYFTLLFTNCYFISFCHK